MLAAVMCAPLNSDEDNGVYFVKIFDKFGRLRKIFGNHVFYRACFGFYGTKEGSHE